MIAIQQGRLDQFHCQPKEKKGEKGRTCEELKEGDLDVDAVDVKVELASVLINRSKDIAHDLHFLDSDPLFLLHRSPIIHQPQSAND